MADSLQRGPRPLCALYGLSPCRLLLLLAPGADREDERRDPDRNEEDVGYGGHAGREADGTEERVSVDDQDEPAYGGAHDAGRQYADDVGRDGGGDQTTEEQGPYDRPRHLCEAKSEEEPDARAHGDHELAGIDGADDLTWLHASGREQRRRRDGTPASAAEGVEEPGHEPERAQEPRRDRPHLDGTLGPPERELAEDVDPEYEQEYGDRRLHVSRRRLQGGRPDQHQRSQESPNPTRNGEPDDLGPVHVAEARVRDPRNRRGPYLRHVYGRRS